MKAPSMRRIPVWPLLFWMAFSIHVITFVLRLEVFWPTPALFDFTSFYMAGWAVRLYLSPYRWCEETLLALAEATQTPPPIPLLNSFPLWAWFMQPFSWLNFPLAAWLWLAIQMFMLVWCAIALARLAGVETRKGNVIVFVLLMTFGPTALTLALGQSALIALTAALLLAEQQRAVHAFRLGLALLAWLAALATKLFPLFWPIVFLLQRKLLLFVTASVALLFFAAGHFLVTPTLTAEYFFMFLPGRVDEFSTLPGRDDQSLPATIQRLFAGEASLLSFVAAGVVLAWLGLLVLRLTIRGARLQEYTAPFFAWVLFCLLPFPHTERYNHVLLAPAMAWLWGNGERAQRFALAGYTLAAVARLTRLWEQLPAPLPAVMSIAGAAAAIVLIVGIADMMNHADSERGASPLRAILTV
jgi:alpha-1,2-mannosyltransferase